MLIDTSTTAGKIQVMQAELDGKEIEIKFLGKDGCWTESSVNSLLWNWREYNFRIKPQTIEEAAKEYAKKEECLSVVGLNSFIAGAKWQKEQDNDV